MGGRGASSAGRNKRKYFYKNKWLNYGDEYETILAVGNIKFVKTKEGSANAPLETATDDRVYVTLGKDNNPKYITFYDKEGKKELQIDLSGSPHYIDGEYKMPHVHIGYDHKGGNRAITGEEKKYIDKVMTYWQQYIQGTQ